MAWVCGAPRSSATFNQGIHNELLHSAEGIRTNGSMYRKGHELIALLKACTKLKDLRMGIERHADAARLGLLYNDPFVGSTLVDMYAKCGSLIKAQETFDGLPRRDIVCWTALMKGYTDSGCGERALECFVYMQEEGFFPNPFTFSCALKACGIIGDLDKGQEIHNEVERQGLLETDVFVGSNLVDMYARFGFLGTAQEIFNKLPIRNVVSWTVLIGGYADLGYGREAIQCFQKMQLEGISPTAATYVCVLKACGKLKHELKGLEVHAEIEKWGLLERELVLGSSLVDMYVKCGSLSRAQNVFEKLPVRNVVLWNALITGYAEQGLAKEALESVNLMRSGGIAPDSITFLNCLKACHISGDIDKGQEIHVEIERARFLETDITVVHALIDMYAKLGSLAKAKQVFDKVPSRNIVLWNTLIAGYAKHEQGHEALQCLEQMRLEGVLPNSITLVCSLKACRGVGAMLKGRELHSEIEQLGMCENLFVLSALVDMYAQNGLLTKAQQVFSMLPDKDVIAWTTLIAGYADYGHGEEALKALEEMLSDGISPNAITFMCSLKACGSLEAADKAEKLYEEVEKEGLLERDLFVGNTVVDMYGKCGLLSKAQSIFNKLPVRNVVVWNTLLAAYATNGCSEETFACYERMQAEGTPPNSGTFVSILRACGHVGASSRGQTIHAEIERLGLMERDVAVANGLVAMYVKCDFLTAAQRVFDKLLTRDIGSCNALMAGYAQRGDSKRVLSVFDRLIGEGVEPDLVTYYTVLNTCNRKHLSSECEMYYEVMSRDYGVAPTIKHLSCMVHTLGHAGQLDQALTMIGNTCEPSNFSPWHALLSACQSCGHSKLGQLVFQHTVYSNEQNDGIAFLSSIQDCHN
ncbi:hypothetical protein GOP47_0001132 [Adiantum capillus-veneris]|uniref:Pentatricopeptide repeat-containing protein n=1 Tax=Adiantum capillus-veneris TaxID=13818 RepID=A0A9D4VGA5_ADICA|nr:hypothetical protein GOP47_0001132 [Adiantum capillus-veneris]